MNDGNFVPKIEIGEKEILLQESRKVLAEIAKKIGDNEKAELIQLMIDELSEDEPSKDLLEGYSDKYALQKGLGKIITTDETMNQLESLYDKLYRYIQTL